ncbi:MAG: phosphate-starvation-inducible PsiE family protein [Betaproteobacteria bacterium]|nr:MAG: phosphate-starvation-inducible PsiE family protein [Betaproteobacteria bacterium]
MKRSVPARRTSRYALKALRIVEDIGLIIIAGATVIAGYQEVRVMVEAGRVALGDLLLMFIYLEVLTMIGLYFDSGQLPVRFPLYIGMVALTRYLILDMKDMDLWRMVGVSASVVLLALAVLLIRYGHVRYPYRGDSLAAREARAPIAKPITK